MIKPPLELLPSMNVSCLGEHWSSIHPVQASSAVPLGGGTVCDCPAASCLNQIEFSQKRLTALAAEGGDEQRAGCSQTLPLFPVTLLDL